MYAIATAASMTLGITFKVFTTTGNGYRLICVGGLLAGGESEMMFTNLPDACREMGHQLEVAIAEAE